MGRKSKAAERTNEILDAFEQCIIAYGFEGATLQRTADHAQVNLGIIHHYIGRKDDLLNAMIKRFVSRTQAEMAEFDRYVPEKKRLPTLLDAFFDDTASDDDRLLDALYASSDNSIIKAALEEITQLYVSIWATEIGRIHPTQPTARCNEIAVAVLALVFGRDLLAIKGVRKSMWRESAEILINNP